jgi:hypothetical protein
MEPLMRWENHNSHTYEWKRDNLAVFSGHAYLDRRIIWIRLGDLWFPFHDTETMRLLAALFDAISQSSSSTFVVPPLLDTYWSDVQLHIKPHERGIRLSLTREDSRTQRIDISNDDFLVDFADAILDLSLRYKEHYGEPLS